MGGREGGIFMRGNKSNFGHIVHYGLSYIH